MSDMIGFDILMKVKVSPFYIKFFFFLENARELLFILLRRDGGSGYNVGTPPVTTEQEYTGPNKLSLGPTTEQVFVGNQAHFTKEGPSR